MLHTLHLSQEEKEESAAAQQVEDSIAIAKQSSSDKSQEIIKSRSSVPFTAKLAIAVLMMITAVAVIFFIRRYLAGRRRHFGHRLPKSLPGSSGGALFGGEDWRSREIVGRVMKWRGFGLPWRNVYVAYPVP